MVGQSHLVAKGEEMEGCGYDELLGEEERGGRQVLIPLVLPVLALIS